MTPPIEDTSAVNSTLDQTVSSGNSIRESQSEIPKLRSNGLEEYLRWKRYVKWWSEATKLSKTRWGTQIMMHGVIDPEVSEVIHGISDEEITGTEGLANLIKTLDDHFLDHTEGKLFTLWRRLLDFSKTDEMTWMEYIKRIKTITRGLEKYGLSMSDRMKSIAMIEAGKLDQNTKLHVESVARNLNENQNLVPKCVEDSLRRLDSNEAKIQPVHAQNCETEIKEDENDEESKEKQTLWVRNARGKFVPFRRGGINKRGARGFRGRFSYKRGNCYTCGSDRHYAANCDQKQNNAHPNPGNTRGKDPKSNNQDNFTGLVERMEDQEDNSFEIFAVSSNESSEMNMIVDTGTTKTVIGENILWSIMNQISQRNKQLILQSKMDDKEKSKFKFGDGRLVHAKYVVLFPMTIGKRTVKLKTFVLPGKVPFLIGIEALRKMNANIDVVNNNISLLGNKMKTEQSVSGHITMRVEINHDSEIQQSVFVMKDEKAQERDELKRMMYRLHVKFGHAHSKQISNLIVKSNLLEEFKGKRVQ